MPKDGFDQSIPPEMIPELKGLWERPNFTHQNQKRLTYNM